MKFDKPEDVASVVYYLRNADIPRSSNRALINSLANGEPPYTQNEADDNNINTNVNFLDLARICHDARNSFYNGFLKPGYYFTVKVDKGPSHKRSEYSRIITQEINRCMKKSLAYTETKRSKFAQTTLHGVGPVNWENSQKWVPKSVAIGDLMIPAKTLTSMDNLEYFALYRQYTPWKFMKMTSSKTNPGWNKKMVKKVIDRYKNEALQMPEFSEEWNPEEITEMFKENPSGFMDSEAIPTINCWDFYFLDEESDERQWHRRMILDNESVEDSEEDFLYEPKRVFADDLSHILHILFADGANVAPFRYHSVRGLGWLLYAVCHLQNRLRCKFNDAVFEQFLWYFYVQNPADRERLDKVDLHTLGVLPEGLKFVPAGERYTPNPQLVNNLFAINRQTMAESSAQFRQDINDGTSKEMTAAETMARVNSANALVSGMLNNAYNYEKFEYIEISRRFCIKDSSDKDVKKFQEYCRKRGVPEEVLDVNCWEVEPERVLGAGNKTLEIAQARELMSARPLFDPEPQREILHIFTEAVTDDPATAERLVPISKKIVSDSVHDAQLASAALMLGMPVSIKTGMNHIEYIEAMLVSLGSVIARIEQSGGVADARDLAGLQNLSMHIAQHIQILAQDKNEKQRVKKYGDALGKFQNLIKAYAQRLQEQMQNQNGASAITPEAQAKIASSVVVAQSNAKINEAKARQKMIHSQQKFEMKQSQTEQSHRQNILTKAETTEADIAAKDAQTAADITLQGIETKADINQQQQTTE